MKAIPFPRWIRPVSDSIVANEQQLGRSGWLPFVHLAWSIWVFITPFFSSGEFGLTWRWALITLVSYPLFVGLYFVSQCAGETRARMAALGMLLLSVVLLPWYPSGLSYFVFGCVLIQPRKRGSMPGYFGILLFANAILGGCAYWIGYPVVALLWIPVVTVVIGLIVAADRASERHMAELKLSHDEVRRLAALAERERISRDLHDLLGHTLSMVAIKADLAGKLLQRDVEAARTEIAEVGDVARQALAQVRGAVSGIRATGIAAELASARLLLETDGVQFDYRIEDAFSANKFSQDVEHVLAMVVREAATNILRHAKATKASARFTLEAGYAVLRIQDNGRGGTLNPGNGLGGMRERIAGVDGTLQTASAEGGGTQLHVRIPLADTQQEAAA